MILQKARARNLSMAAFFLAASLLTLCAQAQEALDSAVSSLAPAKSIWQRAATPSPGANNILFSLSADSGNDIWSVGDFVALHFNGKTWGAKPLVLFQGHGSFEATMNAVAAISPTDVWAVGDTLENIVFPGNGDFVGVTEHFDGTKWTLFQTVPGAELLAVQALSANDIFAVGDINSGNQQPSPTLIHFDGTSWSTVTLPSLPNGQTGVLRGIAALSDNNIWVVGDSGGVVPTNMVAMHFDGQQWSLVTVPLPAKGNLHDVRFGHGITAIAPNDIWAVGGFTSLASPTQKTLTEHWDGEEWKIVPSANGGLAGSGNVLTGVAAISSTDVWACGQTQDSDLGFTNLIEHWDGKRWTVSAVAHGNGFAQLSSVLAFPSGSVFVAGSDIAANSQLISVILHTNQGK